MAFVIPKKIKNLTHGGVIKALLADNKDYAVPSRTNWPQHVPDLVHGTEKITVEVELSDLDRAWGQCLSYYRLGSEKIHLLLTPKLFAQYESDERSYVVGNPIPNIFLHKLPVVEKRRGRPPQKTATREVTVPPPDEKFHEPSDSKRQSSRLEPWKDYSTSRRWSRKGTTLPRMRPLSGRRRRGPKGTQRFKPNSADSCEYCHLFMDNPVLEHTLCCGRGVESS